MIRDIKEYAEILISRGFQKDTSKINQQIASVFTVLYTQLVKDEKSFGKPKAVFDYEYIRRLIDETKISDGRG